MAKKQSNSDELDNIFSQLIAEQNKIVPNSAVSGDDLFAAVMYFIRSGSIVLDTILSNKENGGWPAGRTIELFGEESIGKSTLAFAGMAKVQQAGGVAIYYDVEQAGSQEMMRACGVDLKRLVVSNLTSIEDIFATLEKTLQMVIGTKEFRGKPCFVCIDSLAQMSTDAEIEGDYDFNMNIDLKKSRQLGKALRKITPFLNKANACLLIVNQTRDAVGNMFGGVTTPGGKALKFAASQRVQLMGKTPVVMMDPKAEEMYRAELTKWEDECRVWKETGGSKTNGPKPKKPEKPKGDDIIIGYDVIAKTIKNKCAPPRREAEFRIIFSKGIVEEFAWFDYAIKFGEVSQGQYSYTFKLNNFPELGEFKREQWLNYIADEKIYNHIKSVVVKGLIRPIESLVPRDLDDNQIEDFDDDDGNGTEPNKELESNFENNA